MDVFDTALLNQALQTRGHEFSSEALVRRRTEVIFTVKNDPAAAGYRQAGIPVVMTGFTDFLDGEIVTDDGAGGGDPTGVPASAGL